MDDKIYVNHGDDYIIKMQNPCMVLIIMEMYKPHIYYYIFKISDFVRVQSAYHVSHQCCLIGHGEENAILVGQQTGGRI